MSLINLPGGHAPFYYSDSKDTTSQSSLFWALKLGKAETINNIAAQMTPQMPLESRLKILSQASFWGIPGHSGRYEALLSGLYEAIRGGHAEAVTAYGALLEGIPPGFLPALLNAQSFFVDSDIYRAIWDGHIEAVEAYANLLDKFLPQQRQRHSTLIRMAINFISASDKAREYCATAVNMVRTGPQKLNSYTEYYLDKYGSAISDILGEQEFVLGG